VSGESCDVLLVAAAWQSRALLLAQLQEQGWEVTALPGLRHALRVAISGRVRPRLILLDVHADSDATLEYVEQIPELIPGVPLVLLTGAFDAEAWQPMQDRAAEILRRPLSVGEVVEAVRRHLAHNSAHGEGEPGATGNRRS
jgi:DNA-binding NtrC family response regulator